MKIEEILQKATEYQAADIFLVAGIPVTYKCNGKQIREGKDRLMPDTLENLVRQIYTVSGRSTKNLDLEADDDFSFSLSQMGRFRVNVFRQRGSVAAVIRVSFLDGVWVFSMSVPFRESYCLGTVSPVRRSPDGRACRSSGPCPRW